MESFKDKLNWGQQNEDEVDQEAPEDHEGEDDAREPGEDRGFNLSILSESDEDLILCLTELHYQEDTKEEEEAWNEAGAVPGGIEKYEQGR